MGFGSLTVRDMCLWGKTDLSFYFTGYRFVVLFDSPK